MKYGVLVSDRKTEQNGIDLSAFTNEMEDVGFIPVFVDTSSGTISWNDKYGTHGLSLSTEQHEVEFRRNIPLSEHVGLMELLAGSLPKDSIVVFRDVWAVSKYPDVFFHIYRQFRRRNISVRFIDAYWLNSDALRCVGLESPEVETQLILNLVNLTYQNHGHGKEDFVQYSNLPIDSAELKKNREGNDPDRSAV